MYDDLLRRGDERIRQRLPQGSVKLLHFSGGSDASHEGSSPPPDSPVTLGPQQSGVEHHGLLAVPSGRSNVWRNAVDVVNTSNVCRGVFASPDVPSRHLIRRFPSSAQFLERVRFPAAPPQQARPKGLACFVFRRGHRHDHRGRDSGRQERSSSALIATLRGSKSLAMTSSTTASLMSKYSWMRKFRMAEI